MRCRRELSAIQNDLYGCQLARVSWKVALSLRHKYYLTDEHLRSELVLPVTRARNRARKTTSGSSWYTVGIATAFRLSGFSSSFQALENRCRLVKLDENNVGKFRILTHGKICRYYMSKGGMFVTYAFLRSKACSEGLSQK